MRQKTIHLPKKPQVTEQTVEIPDVPRASKLGIESGSTITKESEHDTKLKLQMREPQAKWARKLPGLPCGFYEELAKIPSSDIGAEEERQLQELCQRLSETGENTEDAMRAMWGNEFTNAPSGLRQAIRSGLALPETPSGVAQYPSDWTKGALLNVRNTGADYTVTLYPEEYDPRSPERALHFTNPAECQNFVSRWYTRESFDPRAY